jgi:hypothetical protein
MSRSDPVDAAVLAAMIERFDAQGVVGSPTGRRVFVRWVCTDPLNPGWDDWSLACEVGAPECAPEIAAAIAAGRHHGRTRHGHTTGWWCRADLDGPPGERVTDFMRDG